jgi:hypothetical protein
MPEVHEQARHSQAARELLWFYAILNLMQLRNIKDAVLSSEMHWANA